MTAKNESSLCFFPQRCLACGLCVEACRRQESRLTAHDGPVPARGRLAVYQANDGPHLAVCRQCTTPPCVEVCPSGALVKDEAGRVVLDSGGCVGCQACVDVCPFRAIFFEGGIAYKCDLCSGTAAPPCVIACPQEALLWQEARQVAAQRRRFRTRHLDLTAKVDGSGPVSKE